jgi:hypothetical protein
MNFGWCFVFGARISFRGCRLAHASRAPRLIVWIASRIAPSGRWYVLQVWPLNRIWNSAVGIATGYGLDDRGVGVRVPVGSRIFCSSSRSDQLWDTPSLLSDGYRWLFLRGLGDRRVELTTHLQLVPRPRKCGSIHPLPHTPSWRSASSVKQLVSRHVCYRNRKGTLQYQCTNRDSLRE